MINHVKEALESDFSDSKQYYEEAERTGDDSTYNGSDIFNRHDYSNLLSCSLTMMDEHADFVCRAESRELDLRGQLEAKHLDEQNLIHITDGELWCIMAGLELCSGDDFDPLYYRMAMIGTNRKDRKLKDQVITIDGEEVELPLSILKMIKGALK